MPSAFLGEVVAHLRRNVGVVPSVERRTVRLLDVELVKTSIMRKVSAFGRWVNDVVPSAMVCEKQAAFSDGSADRVAFKLIWALGKAWKL